MNSKFSEIGNAFDFVSCGASLANSVLLDKATGEFYFQSELGDSDEIPADVLDSESLVAMPHKYDLERLGFYPSCRRQTPKLHHRRFMAGG